MKYSNGVKVGKWLAETRAETQLSPSFARLLRPDSIPDTKDLIEILRDGTFAEARRTVHDDWYYVATTTGAEHAVDRTLYQAVAHRLRTAPIPPPELSPPSSPAFRLISWQKNKGLEALLASDAPLPEKSSKPSPSPPARLKGFFRRIEPRRCERLPLCIDNLQHLYKLDCDMKLG